MDLENISHKLQKINPSFCYEPKLPINGPCYFCKYSEEMVIKEGEEECNRKSRKTVNSPIKRYLLDIKPFMCFYPTA